MPADNLSWRTKLSGIREQVVEAEKDRELRKQLEKERSRDALADRLKRDTPEALIGQFNELKRKCQLVGRRLYPPQALREQLAALADLGNRLRLYKEAQREHGTLFSVPMKQAINRLLNSLGEIQHSLDKQLSQWQGVEQILTRTVFRPRTAADDARLLEIAKSFSHEAYEVTLSLPSDYFAREHQHFYVAQSAQGVYGYVRVVAENHALVLALAAASGVNFKKLVRGVLHQFCTSAPEPLDHALVRIALTDPREFRFYQDMGFRRDPAAPDGLVCLTELE